MACFATTPRSPGGPGTDSLLALITGRIEDPFDQLSVLFASDSVRANDGLSSTDHSSKWPASYKMHVKVKYFLITISATINKKPITVLGDAFLLGDISGYDEKISK